MSLSSTFPSFEDSSGFNNSPFGPNWEKEASQQSNFKLLLDNASYKGKDITPEYSLALATDITTIEKRISTLNGTYNFTVFIVAKSGTIKNFSGTTREASEFTGLKIENIIEIKAVEIGYNLLGKSLSKETIQRWVTEYDKWMNPSGFFSKEQLDFIFKEAVRFYESNKFTFLTQPVTNKILIMLLEALRNDLQYYFNEDYVAKFLQQIALEFKKNALITDSNRWNPYLITKQRNPEYNPFFITNINDEKITIAEAVQEFEDWLKQSSIDGILIYALQTIVPKEISILLSAISKYVKDGFIEMYQDAKAMLQTFADLPEMYNAFLVGLYNGLIRFLASLIEMVGFFVSLANPGNWESFVEGFKKFFSEFWSTLKTLITAYFKKFTDAQNPVDFIKIFVEEVTGIAIELFLLYVSLGASAAKKLAEGLERLLKNPKATVDDWMDYFKKRKKDEGEEKQVEVEVDNIKGKGLYDGKVLSKTDIDKWRKLLKEKFDTKLEKVDSFDSPNVLAQYDPNTNTIRYKDDVTEYFMVHESFHAEELKKIGFDDYVKDAHIKGTPWTIENRITQYKREKYVYERIVENAKAYRLNAKEVSTPPFGHAFQYFDTLRYELEILLKENNFPFPQ